jgi:hypothetical protein
MPRHEGWHQTKVDEAHEATGTIKALQEAAQKGAEVHLQSLTATTPKEN